MLAAALGPLAPFFLTAAILSGVRSLRMRELQLQTVFFFDRRRRLLRFVAFVSKTVIAVDYI